jgi:diguanylate cyclase (GGDEF)-like protein/PAS domain S-box-containing protein
MKPTVEIPEQAGADESFHTALFHHSPAATLITRVSDGEVQDVNEPFCRLTGYRREELIGNTTTALGLYANPRDRERLVDAFRRDGQVRDIEIDVRARSGEIRSVVASFEAIRVNGADCFIGSAVDVTQRKRAERAVAESESRFRHLTTMTNDLFYSCRRMEDGLFRVEWLGGDADRLFGIGNDELTAAGCWCNLVVEDDRPLFDRYITALKPGSTSNAVLRVKHRDGTVRHVQSFAHVEEDGDGQKFERLYGALQDISERVALEQRLERLARTDFLTGLANRRHFLELADRELARVRRYGSPLSLAMLDLDHFKDINDTYGHKVGDTVLEQFARICRQALRESDIMGRTGGEEFAILFPETTLPEALDVAERLRETVAATHIPLEHGLPIQATVSVGVASFANADVNIDVFMNRADAALYEAKRGGRNRTAEAAVPTPLHATRTAT